MERIVTSFINTYGLKPTLMKSRTTLIAEISLCLVLMMSLTLSACGGGDDESTHDMSDASAPVADEDAGEPGDEDASEPGDEDASEPGDEDASEPGDEDASEPGDEDTGEPEVEAPPVRPEIMEQVAEINAGLQNVEVEVYQWPAELHEQLGQMDPYAFVTRPIEHSGPLPLIISLHGGGVNFQNLDLETQLAQDTPRGWNLAERAAREVMFLDPFIHEGWNPDHLDRMLDHVLENFSDVDTERVFVMGYSRGGGGTYDWIRQSGDRFGAAAPCGFSSYRENHDLTKMVDLPMWTAAGTDDADRAAKVSNMVERLQTLGNRHATYKPYEGMNHYLAGRAVYSAVELVDRMLEFSVTP